MELSGSIYIFTKTNSEQLVKGEIVVSKKLLMHLLAYSLN